MHGFILILALAACAAANVLPSKEKVIVVEKPIIQPPKIVVVDRKVPMPPKIIAVEKEVKLPPENIIVKKPVPVMIPSKPITIEKEILVNKPVLVDTPIPLPPKIITVERKVPIPTPVIVERPVPIPRPIIYQKPVPVLIHNPSNLTPRLDKIDLDKDQESRFGLPLALPLSSPYATPLFAPLPSDFQTIWGPMSLDFPTSIKDDLLLAQSSNLKAPLAKKSLPKL